MDVRVLGYVVAVAETGSITRAAERCHVAQPSLSRQLAALERELGEPLFVRGRDGAALTDAGRVLMPYARAALAALDRARSTFAERAGLITGALRLGVVAGIVDTAVPAAIAALTRAHPQLRVQVVGGPGAELVDRVHSRDLDAAVVVTELEPLPSGVTALTLLTEQVVAVFDPAFLPGMEPGQPLTPRSLDGQPIVTYSRNSEIGRLLDRALGEVSHRALCLTDDQSLHIALAAERAGIALTAGSSIVRSHRDHLDIRPLQPAIHFRKRLIWRVDVPPSPALNALLRSLAPESS